jgi:hypothetical protein
LTPAADPADNAAMPPEAAQRALREASLELARLRRLRGAYRKTWRRIARAQARLAFAAALLAAAPVAEPAAAADPSFRHGFVLPPVLVGRPAPAFADIDGDGDLDLFVGAGDQAEPADGSILFLQNSGTATQPVFGSLQTNPFGLADVGTYAVPSLADLDGDGDLDVLVGTVPGRAIYFRNTGTTTVPAFAAPLTNPFGLAALVVELADLDGDGDFDAFSWSATGVVFHENTGTASSPAFAAPVTNPFGLGVDGFSNPSFADIDGDGDLDALVSVHDYNAPTIDLFENTGTSTAPAFAAPQANPFGLLSLYPGIADFADVDGDGDLDALITGGYGETGFWLTLAFDNTGSSSTPAFTRLGNPFGLGAMHCCNTPSSSHELVDIDDDGDLDAFSGDGNSVGFLRNVGTPNAPVFGNPPNPYGLVGNDPVVADVDADGDPDVILGAGSGDTVFFENTATAAEPAFAAPLTNAFGLAGVGGYAAPDFGDLDGDGDLDALIGNAEGDSVLFENTGTSGAPAFAAPLTNPFGLTGVTAYSSPDLADIDGDGDLDLFVGEAAGNVLLFENTGTVNVAAFADPLENPFGLVLTGYGRYYASPDLADVDGDGDLDAFVGHSGGNTSFLRNTGTASTPAFVQSAISSVGIYTAGSYAAPELGDLDGDGNLDALIGSLDGDVFFYRGTPVQPAFRLLPSSGLSGREPAFVDIDADGDLDAFFGQSNGSTRLHVNTRTASVPAFAAPSTNPFGLASVGGDAAPAFGDTDGDGDLDAFVGNRDGNTVFFENTGTAAAPAFGSAQTNPFGLADVGANATPDFGDVDGDGDLDLFVGEVDGNVLFFENTGTATTPAFAAPRTNPFGLADVGLRASPEVADIDGDGDLDLFVRDVIERSFFFENVTIDPEACSDGLDNDGDGRIDLGNDPGCASAADPSELGAVQCDNGLDDDSDGLADFRPAGGGDPHCTGPLDDREAPNPPGPGCGLGPELLLLGPLLEAERRRCWRSRSRG